MKADIGPVTPKWLAATISRTSPAIRDSPVAAEKKSVLTAKRRRRAAGALAAPAGRTGGVTSLSRCRAEAAIVGRRRDEKSSLLSLMANVASQESASTGRSGSGIESPLHVCDQDLLPPSRGRGRGRRRRPGRDRTPRAGLACGPRREAPRAASQQRGAQEGARRAAALPAELSKEPLAARGRVAAL